MGISDESQEDAKDEYRKQRDRLEGCSEDKRFDVASGGYWEHIYHPIMETHDIVYGDE